MSGQRAFTREKWDVTFCPHFVPYHAVQQVTQIVPLRAVRHAALPALSMCVRSRRPRGRSRKPILCPPDFWPLDNLCGAGRQDWHVRVRVRFTGSGMQVCEAAQRKQVDMRPWKCPWSLL
eukprot:364708-Chlamydomonas_euryale.AAC.6